MDPLLPLRGHGLWRPECSLRPCPSLLCGPTGLAHTLNTGVRSPFLTFFSIHTSATIGYGDTVPVGLPANILVALESVVSLLGLAVVTGLVFARFSRPVADILFSESTVVAKSGDFKASSSSESSIPPETARSSTSTLAFWITRFVEL